MQNFKKNTKTLKNFSSATCGKLADSCKQLSSQVLIALLSSINSQFSNH